MIYKAYKFRMYPTKEQEVLINKTIGSSRFIYNYYLDKKQMLYKEYNINYNIKDMKKDLIPLYSEYPWLKEIDSMSLRTTLDNLDVAYTNFYDKRSELPKYKKKSINGSYITSCIRSTYKGTNYANIKVDIQNKTIKLPKLKEVKIKGYRNITCFP